MNTPTPDTIQAWASDLAALHRRIAHHVKRAEPRRRALAYLRGLLSPLARKNAWQLAEHADETTLDGIQRLISTACWDADAGRDDLGALVNESLADLKVILIVDERASKHSRCAQNKTCTHSRGAKGGRACPRRVERL